MSPRYRIQRIIVCLDATTDSALRVAYALSLAGTFNSAVTLMHVMQHHGDRFGPHTTDALGWEVARQEARSRLECLEREATRASDCQIGIRLEQGMPAERIVALSRELEADLVVLGSHEASERPAWYLGSVAQQVLAAARSSVLIARGSGEPSTFVPPKRILVPLDGSQRTESVLPTAESIARAHGAQIVLAHVVAEPVATGVLSAPEDLLLARELATRLEVQATRYLETLRHQMGYDDSLVEARVERHADERQFLVELSDREQIDLVVMSTHGSLCNAARPFGSVTSHFLTHSKVPLLVVQNLPPSDDHTQDESDDRSVSPRRGTHPADNV